MWVQSLADTPRHRSVASIKNLFEDNGTLYYTLEYLEGESLYDYIERNHPLRQEEIDKILYPLIDGVIHLHNHNIQNIGLNLSTIVVSNRVEPIVIDFREDMGDEVSALLKCI